MSHMISMMSPLWQLCPFHQCARPHTRTHTLSLHHHSFHTHPSTFLFHSSSSPHLPLHDGCSPCQLAPRPNRLFLALCVCVCVCVCACECVRVCVCMCACVCARVYVRVCMCACLYMCSHICVWHYWYT